MAVSLVVPIVLPAREIQYLSQQHPRSLSLNQFLPPRQPEPYPLRKQPPMVPVAFPMGVLSAATGQTEIAAPCMDFGEITSIQAHTAQLTI